MFGSYRTTTRFILCWCSSVRYGLLADSLVYFCRVSLKTQKRLAASVMKCGQRKIWLDPNEVVEISNANSRMSLVANMLCLRTAAGESWFAMQICDWMVYGMKHGRRCVIERGCGRIAAAHGGRACCSVGVDKRLPKEESCQ
jgi:hypothetical protein